MTREASTREPALQGTSPWEEAVRIKINSYLVCNLDIKNKLELLGLKSRKKMIKNITPSKKKLKKNRLSI